MSRPFSFGPVALTNTYTTNILNPAAAGSGTGYTPTATFIVLTKIRVTNITGGPITFRLYKNGSGVNTAGKELAYDKNVPANDSVEIFGENRFDAADFLVGGASAGTSLSIEGEGYASLA
jgi:hypothetical protein